MRRRKIKISINGKEIMCFTGETVLDVARKNGLKIPSLCFHPDLEASGGCRLCLISIKDRKGFFTACSTKVERGMVIVSDSPEIRKLRKVNLEMLFAQHVESCRDCMRSYNCRLLALAGEYDLDLSKFDDRKRNYPVLQFGPAILFKSEKCIDCRNCVEVCKKQGVEFLEVEEHDSFMEVAPSKKKNKDCIYCGQCIAHCPVAAFEEADSIKDVEAALKDKKKFVVFQFAPSIRVSIGEEFGMPYGTVVTDKLIGAIRQLGAKRVFDVSVAADVTTIEEANELIERVKQGKKLPMFTSCCPAWVKFVEFYYPKFISRLTSVRSPQIILGGIIKKYVAEKEKVDPKKIVVVSVMPCTSKKYEITRKELQLQGLNPVDFVLTTHELACLLKSHDIDLNFVQGAKLDHILGDPSGAGVIYGASGGVTESALRTAIRKLTGRKNARINFKKVRGMEEVKEAVVDLGGVSLRVAVVNGLGNARDILEKLKKNPKLYDYVEIMACFGGCIGGGGQPVPTSREIRAKRAKGLYKIDEKKQIRLADDNPAVQELYKNFLKNKEITHEICHTKYFPKKKEKVKIIKK
ncbi:MAG: [FeFe] hydrogenase, group A [Candidatus Pacebacteria bacterium]|nr:[FeFe] hydrogenase, group A [Candidatus Paceibacterota bacterium]